MVWDAILSVIFGLLELVVGLLPDFDPWSISPEVMDSAETLGNQMWVFRDWVDLGTMGTLVLAMGVAWVAAGGVRFVTWLYEKMPFKGT